MALLNKAKVTFSVILSVKIYVKHNKKTYCGVFGAASCLPLCFRSMCCQLRCKTVYLHLFLLRNSYDHSC